ncbi:hypothetical protein BH10PAT3_BH10PAT3_2070 [soil metagenome]
MLVRCETAPYDPLTGITCAIAPRKSIPNEKANDTSFHHRQHSEAELLKLGLLGRAIRTSCIQLAFNDDHNNGPSGYHRYFDRSHLPSSRMGLCGLVIFNSANAVADQVIDMPAQEIRPITAVERQRLFSSHEQRIQSDFSVRRYFTAFVLDRVGCHSKRADIVKFQDSRHEADRLSIANDMIGRLIPEAFAPLSEKYNEALERGILPEGAPPSPAEVARQFIFQEPARYSMLNDVIFNESRNLWLPVLSNGQYVHAEAA